jgi:prevent-host-death family protein
MKEIPVTQARPKLSELIGKVARGKRFVIAQKGKRGTEKAVLVGLEEFEGLRRQSEFRQVFQDIRTQARAALRVQDSLDDDAAMKAADQLIHELRRERRARRA